VGDVIPIDDVVVPVALSRLESCTLEAECTFPRTRLGGVLVLGKRKLAGVIVPGAEQVHGLDGG